VARYHAPRLNAEHVNVLAFLAPSAYAQLLRALPPPHRVTNALDWNAVSAAIRERAYDVAVLDPCAGGDQSCTERLRTLVDASAPTIGTPVIAYLSVTANAIHSACAFARLAPPHASNVVVRGLDDAPEAFATTVQHVVSSWTASQLVNVAGAPFGALPPSAVRAVETLFRRPERMRSVSALAAEAGTTRRSLDRWLARAGLASARTLLACARANAAFHLIAGGHVRTARAADLLGYSSSRALARELHALTGCVPSAIRTGLTHSAFAAALARQLRRPRITRTPPAY